MIISCLKSGRRCDLREHGCKFYHLTGCEVCKLTSPNFITTNASVSYSVLWWGLNDRTWRLANIWSEYFMLVGNVYDHTVMELEGPSHSVEEEKSALSQWSVSEFEVKNMAYVHNPYSSWALVSHYLLLKSLF